MATGREKKEARALTVAIGVLGAVFGLWAFSAFTSLFAQLGWSPGEVLRQYMVATGALAEHETLVDYYTHIKGAEYIIAVAFLGLYPVFYKYVNRTRVRMKA
jgi:hypothetical protein